MRKEAAEWCRKHKEKREAWLRDVNEWRVEQLLMEIRRVTALARAEHAEAKYKWEPYDL